MKAQIFFPFVFLLLLTGLSIPVLAIPPSPQDNADAGARYRALLKLISGRQYAEAMTQCQALIESHPDFEAPYNKLALIARETKQAAQTQAWLEKLAGTNPRAFYSLGLLERDKNQHQAGIALQIKCLEATPGFIRAARALVQSALALKKPEAAETFFKSRPNDATSAYGLGWLYQHQQKYQQALEMYEQASKLSPQLLEPRLEKMITLLFFERLPEALAQGEELQSVISENTDPELRLLLYDNKGTLQYRLSRFPQAIRDLSVALQIAREYGWTAQEERLLSLQATSWYLINHFSEALQGYQQALELSRNGNRAQVSRRLGNIGLVYWKLGEQAKAVEYYQQSIAAARQSATSDPDSLINFLINLSDLHLETHQAGDAQPLLEEAQQIIGSSSDTWRQFLIQTGWGRYHYYTRDYRQSLNFQQTALGLMRERKDPLQQGICWNWIGECQAEMQNRPAALAAYQQALAIGQQIQVLSLIWRAEAGLARLAQESQPEEALLHYRRAIEAIEKIRGQQTSAEEKTGYFQSATDVYQHAALLLTALHHRDPVKGSAKGYAAEAFHLAERIRARSLLDSLTETTAHQEQKLDQDLLDRRTEIQRRLSDAEAQLQKAASDTKTTAETLRTLEARLVQAASDYADWRKQVRRRKPFLADLTYPEPLTLEQTQATLK